MTPEHPVCVTVQDIRVLGYCARGARSFCQQRGIDWAEFLQNGIPADRLAGIDDEMVRAAIEQAHKREQAGGA